MDALIAIVDDSARDLPAAELESMLEGLWPDQARRQAVFQGKGVLLAAARTACGAEALGPPAVREIGGSRVIARFDWPSTAGPAELDGLTRFAWTPETRTLTVTRDPMGECPVWLARAGTRLACATHPALLRALPWVSDEPDPLARAAAETRIPLGAEETLWQALRRLPPGHRLTAVRGAVSTAGWWTPSASPVELEDGSWTDRVRQALEAAVARRIPASGPTGAHLSGGLDSTAVSLLAFRELGRAGRPLHTFSHVPAVRWNPPQPGDETPFIEAALSCMPAAVPHFATGADPAAPDRPTSHDREVREAASAAGILTMLSGWGGDEGVSYNGDGVLAEELLRGHFLWVLNWCRRFGGGSLRGAARIFYHRLVRQLLGRLPPTAGGSFRARSEVLAALGGVHGSLRQDLLQRQRQCSALRQAPSLRENQRRLLSSSHLANRIDQDAEWSVPAGLCFRYPLLDPALLGLVLAAPPRLFVRDGRTRTLLRESMGELYPESIRQRRGKFPSHPRRPNFSILDEGPEPEASAARRPGTGSAPTAR